MMYHILAQRLWGQCVKSDSPTGYILANRRMDARAAQGQIVNGANDAMFDMGSSLVVGENQFASELAYTIANRQRDWNIASPQCLGCQHSIKALFLHYTRNMDVEIVQRAQEQFGVQLLEAQDKEDGSWGGSTLVTAYALIGLHTFPQDPTVKATQDRAIRFLFSMPAAPLRGGFKLAVNDSRELNMATSAALQALSMSAKQGG